MTELQEMHGIAWVAALGQHLAAVVTPLLPGDRELVATGSELAVMVRRDGAPLRVATSYRLPTPSARSVLDAGAVDEILRDLQDDIAVHLGCAWPTAASGTTLSAVARDADGVIEIAFEPRRGDPAEAIVLEPFVPPPPPDEARVAG
ncbi:hypothetical protein EV188_104349 [Actinomycetospora succinea]|uniref:Uncharacterized protein n=2 Tax=Actinomycetospora succinea TaxID=663603 RepID=A0A4R6VD24_9PSEU|nr:hypothetical protein EV188_104349 [Actinomycetospora succinea]